MRILHGFNGVKENQVLLKYVWMRAQIKNELLPRVKGFLHKVQIWPGILRCIFCHVKIIRKRAP